MNQPDKHNLPQRARAQAQLLSRTMRVDDRAALYYLEAAGGDVKAALSAAAADEQWEDATPGPIRLAPVAAYINGHAGL
jgi:hypothetical protein